MAMNIPIFLGVLLLAVGATTVAAQCSVDGWTGPLCDRCEDGRYGSNCEHTCPACVHGTCLDGVDGSGACVCGSDWSGALCATCAGVVDGGETCLRGVVARYTLTLEATEASVVDEAKLRAFRDVLLGVLGLEGYVAAVVIAPPEVASGDTFVVLEVDVLEQDGFQHVQTWLEGLAPPRVFLAPFVVDEAHVRTGDGASVEIPLQRESKTKFTDHAYAGVVIAIAMCMVLVVLNVVLETHDEKGRRHPLRGRYRTDPEKCECECDLHCGGVWFWLRDIGRAAQRRYRRVRTSKPCVAVLGQPRPGFELD